MKRVVALLLSCAFLVGCWTPTFEVTFANQTKVKRHGGFLVDHKQRFDVWDEWAEPFVTEDGEQVDVFHVVRVQQSSTDDTSRQESMVNSFIGALERAYGMSRPAPAPSGSLAPLRPLRPAEIKTEPKK